MVPAMEAMLMILPAFFSMKWGRWPCSEEDGLDVDGPDQIPVRFHVIGEGIARPAGAPALLTRNVDLPELLLRFTRSNQRAWKSAFLGHVRL